MKQIYFVILLLILSLQIQAQPWMQAPYLEINSAKDSAKLTNFYEIQKAFQQYEAEQIAKNTLPLSDDEISGKKNIKTFPGYKQFKRWENYMEARVYPSGDITIPSRKYEEFQKYLNSKNFEKNSNNAIQKKSDITSTFSGNWTAIGPTGTTIHGDYGGSARINFLRFDPTNSNIMYIGSPSGGLWKTTNGGANWTTNTDQLALVGCSDVAVNPKNTNIMYLATGDGNGNGSQLTVASIGVLKSTDGGSNWGGNTMNWSVSSGRYMYKLLINPDHPDTVFVATSLGLYRTTNAGTNWVSVQGGAIFTDVEFKPGNPKIVYATSGVYSTGTFYKSTDGGATFSIITSGLPLSSAVARLEIAITPADTNYVYVLGVKKNTWDFEGIYRSTDGGDNFSVRANTPNILFGSPSSQAWYNIAIAVSPIHKDTLIVGGTDSWKSVDGGLNWSKHSTNTGTGAPYIHSDFHSIEYLPNSDDTYFCGTDGGLHKTTDRGATFNYLNEGLQIAQMYKLGTSELNPNIIVTGHQDMGTFRYNKTKWELFTLNTGDGMECVYERDNDSVIYLASYNGRVIKAYNNYPLFNVICTNNGSGVNAAGSWITPIVMNPKVQSTLLIGKAQIWRTTNSGTSFSQVGDVTGGSTYIIALAYAPSDSNYIYAAKNNKVFISSNGNSFTDRTSGLPASNQITSIAVSNSDPKRAWITYSGYSTDKVWKTTDAGLTWSNNSTGLPNIPVNCIVYNNNTNNELYVGTDVGVYKFNDTLTSWQAFYTGLPNADVQELEIASSIGKIRAATNGRGLWESDLMLQSALTLNVSTNSISLPAIASNTFSFNITSNTAWSISNIPSWFNLSSTSGNGNSNITITSQTNISLNPRNVVLTILGTGVTAKTVSISQDGATPTLSLSTNTISIGASESSSKSFELSSNTNWTITSSQSWINSSNTIGNGSSTITLTAKENTSLSTRQANIIASANGVSSQTISVTQDGALPILSVSTNSLTLASKANSTKSFDILSNTSWTISSNQAWLNTNKTSGQLNSTITLTAQENTNLSSRSATVTISSNTLSQIVSVTQDGVAPNLSVSPSTITLDWKDKSTGIFDVISNTSWTITNNNTWLSIDKNSGKDNDRITLTAQENSTSISRSGLISISSGTINKTVFVLQNKSDDLVDIEISKFILPQNGNPVISTTSIKPKIEIRNNGTKTIKSIRINIQLFKCNENSLPIYNTKGEDIDSIGIGVNNTKIYEFYNIQNLEQKGNYYIRVQIFANGDQIPTNDSLSSKCFLIDTTNSSVEDNINANISIYPNPSNGEININSETLIDKIKVTDMLGKIVYEASPSKKNEIINIKMPGVYFVEVSSEGEI
ncbi:MAG: BACON domain-containing carbohydrate-binding protein [Candidatus Kapabacteria bacterium]|nr:BACON domain-containing carbohydrate-binding protein [Candidatus Kapabacteria bacterium]